jgi:hypothetical protein
VREFNRARVGASSQLCGLRKKIRAREMIRALRQIV